MIHDEFMHTAFRALQAADVLLSEIKTEQNQLDFRKGEAESSIRAAWTEIESLMKESGEYEVLIPGAPGDACDYKIAYSTPRTSIKIADPDAVPDALCKIERKPMLREIAEYLKVVEADNEPLPNWVVREKGEPKLSWRAIKKTGAKS